MNSLLPQLLSFPPHPPQPLSETEYDAQIRNLLKILHGTSASKLVGNISEGDSLINILDPAVNTLPYLYTLLAHANALGPQESGISPGEKLWDKMLIFVSVFDAIQIRYCGHEFRNLIDAILKGVGNSPSMAIEPIRTAMLRLDPTTSTFTSTHLSFVHLCLQSRAFDLALRILNNDIFHFPYQSPKNDKEPSYLPLPCARHETSSTFITTVSGFSKKLRYQDHLQYFLYGAMIYIALEDWEHALSFLEIVLAAPVAINSTSMIQVEAYKKWVLVSLLVHRKVQAMPRNVANHVARHCRAVGKAYDVLVEAFKEADSRKLVAEIAIGPFAHDCNQGLAFLVLDAHHRFALSSLARTYASLPLSKVAELTSPSTMSLPETESYVSYLIFSGQLDASLTTNPAADANRATIAGGSSSETILRFHSAKPTVPTTSTSSTSSRNALRNEAAIFAELQERRARIEMLGVHIGEARHRVELSKEYVEAVRKMRKAEAKGDNSKGFFGIGGGGWGPPVDEDVLADM